ncbi:MAG TPA: substrate-binding domain-containing protein, partial [Tepidisphaeraceae bacterium]|nr:substrate-binding domain-containing protein [Tepidisphaeraceae bacterium]
MQRNVQMAAEESRSGSIIEKLIALVVLAVGLILAGQASAQIVINGAGSTFAYPLYSVWFSAYNKVDPNAQFNYQSIGSGGGIRQVTDGTVDFGATDGPMTPEQMKEFQSKRGCRILHFPTALG